MSHPEPGPNSFTRKLNREHWIDEFEKLCQARDKTAIAALLTQLNRSDAALLAECEQIAKTYGVKLSASPEETLAPLPHSQPIPTQALNIAADSSSNHEGTILLAEKNGDQSNVGSARSSAQDHEPKLRTFGEYDLLNEIARGGMGVVYRARHRQLNRIVALKMILGGGFSSPEVRARFQLEAEAAANLDHPGITPVFDIGEVEGQPYFAMKLIEHGSVENSIAQFEEDPKKSAQLLMLVARAIQHAHERGVLHRDLKPSNVLLDENGAPHVTDFGLAKLTTRESGHTQTGAIMGTPAYMSPEQASGDKNLTTATDIYSLGAILYRLLTGRPTFQSDNVMQIVMKCMTEDPPPPRQCKPSIPIDLELICLKCLSRDRSRRYKTAGDCADDLERWLAGEPISVRQPTLGTLAGVWMKQHLQMAGSAALVGIATGIVLAVTIWFSIFSEYIAYSNSTYSEYFPSLKKPWLSFAAFKGSDWLAAVALILWPLLVGGCGFLTVLVARPNSRSSAASCGLIAGIFCGGLMGLVGAIGPLMAFSINSTNEDIRALSTAAFGKENDSKWAKQSILNRYHDLSRLDTPARAEAMARKIEGDMIAGLPLGLWAGMAFFLSAIPVITFSAAQAWKLVSEADSLWTATWRYIDVAFAFFMLFTFVLLFLFVKSLGASWYVPHWPFLLAFLGSLALAFTAALRRWPWPGRLVIHLSWIILFGLYCYQALQAPRGLEIARKAVAAGDDKAALSALDSYLLIYDQNDAARLQLGLLHAKAGDVNAYQAQCREMLRRFSPSRVPEPIERTAKLCLLSPTLDNSQQTQAAQLSAIALELGADSPNRNWFLLCRALGQYRLGKYEPSLTTIAQIDRNYFFVVNCTADMVAAMAHAQRGETDKGKEVYLNATSQFDFAWREHLTEEGREYNWDNRLFYALLRDEADRLLAQPLSETSPAPSR
jgi:eukaryotic-like serine/threonine-protein kinase